MAKKKESKQQEIHSDLSTNETNVVVVEEIELAEGIQSTPEHILNGQGVGVYYDETLKRYVLVTLSLCPENDSAIITNKKVLRASKMGAIMETEVALKQLLQKELK